MSASAEIHDLIIATLKADAGVSALVGARVYDVPPATAVKPYISLGSTQILRDDEEGIAGRVEVIQVDCWTAEHGRTRTCKAIVDAVTAALHERDLEMTTNALAFIELEQSRVDADDPDGITTHGLAIFRAAIEEA